MEEKFGNWVFTLLLSRNKTIPILDTIIFREGCPYKTLTNSNTNSIQETPSKPLSTLLSTFSTLNCPPSKVIFCIIHKSSCKYIKKREIRLMPKDSFQNIDQIQLLHSKNNLKMNTSIICKVKFTDQRYKSKVFIKNKSGLDKLSKSSIKDNAKDISGRIIRAIVHEKPNQVNKLHIELLVDSENNLFLHRIIKCLLGFNAGSKHNSITSTEQLKEFVYKEKKNRAKSLFEAKSELDVKRENIRKSFDSLKSKNVLTVPEPFNSGFGLRNNSKELRLKRRTLNSRIGSYDFVRSDRKATFMIGETFRKSCLTENDEKLDDSWDYGSLDVDFLEMISRQAIRDGNLARPISPTYEEIKMKMRQINEKYSLTPSLTGKSEFRSDLYKIKINGKEIRKSIKIDNDKLTALKLPCLSGKYKSESRIYGNLLKTTKHLRVQRKSSSSLYQ